MLRSVIAIGVQTWGMDVVALQRYWRRADELALELGCFCLNFFQHHRAYLRA